MIRSKKQKDHLYWSIMSFTQRKRGVLPGDFFSYSAFTWSRIHCSRIRPASTFPLIWSRITAASVLKQYYTFVAIEIQLLIRRRGLSCNREEHSQHSNSQHFALYSSQPVPDSTSLCLVSTHNHCLMQSYQYIVSTSFP